MYNHDMLMQSQQARERGAHWANQLTWPSVRRLLAWLEANSFVELAAGVRANNVESVTEAGIRYFCRKQVPS